MYMLGRRHIGLGMLFLTGVMGRGLHAQTVPAVPARAGSVSTMATPSAGATGTMAAPAGPAATAATAGRRPTVDELLAGTKPAAFDFTETPIADIIAYMAK